MKSLAHKSTSDARLVRRFSQADARGQLLVAKMAFTLWAILVLTLKRQVHALPTLWHGRVVYSRSAKKFLDRQYKK